MHVLVFIDELPTASQALGTAIGLARRIPTEVTLLTVGEGPQAQSILDEARAQLPAQLQENLTVKAIPGEAENVIAEESHAGTYDLIILAPSGRRGLARLMHGSRVSKVVRAVRTSVLIARRSDLEVRRILVGISSAAHSAVDVRAACRLAQAFGAEVVALHVVTQVPLMFTGLAHMRYNLEQFLASETPSAVQLRRAREIMTEYGVRGRLELREGLVRDELLDESNEGYDLLVLGAHVGEGMAGLLLDDVADAMVREASLPTLVLRSDPLWITRQP